MTSSLGTRRQFLVTGAALLTAGCASRIAPAPELFASDETVRRLLQMRIDTQKRGTGAVMAEAAGGALRTYTHGHASIDRSLDVGADSFFQIASLTKIFTALLLAEAVSRGEAKLDDPLSKHLPGAAYSRDGREMTLLDLATHTSGLPLRPPSRVDRSQDDPYSNYSAEELQSDIKAVQLQSVPGTTFVYSNFGYALLGAALARAGGASFAALLSGRILKPLGLRNTTLTPTATQQAKLVQGYGPEFVPMVPWNFGELAPAGGLFSTVSDLSKFLQVWLGEDGRFAAARRIMLAPRRPGGIPDTEMALGWRIRTVDGRRIAWSNGSGGGVRSFLAFDLDRPHGVVGFANMATGLGVDDIGTHLLDPSAPVDDMLPVERIAIDLPADDFAKLAGRYEFEPGDEMEFALNGAEFHFMQGPVRLRVYAESQTLFFIREDHVTFEFGDFGADGRAGRVILSQAGETFVYLRKP